MTGFWPTSSGANGTYSSGCSLRARRTQPAMMPDSTSYSLSPTIGRFGGCVTLARSITNRETSTNFSVLMPEVHAVEAQQRHHDVFHRHVAGALAEAGDRRVRHRRARRPAPPPCWRRQGRSPGDSESRPASSADRSPSSRRATPRRACSTPIVSAIVSASMCPSVATCSTMSRKRLSSVRVASMVKKTV